MSGEGKDPFATLGLPVAFGITKQQIESAYLTRIAAAHPDHSGDRMGSGSGEGASGTDAAALNDARRALRDDETRANLVLAAMGGPTASEDDSLPDGFLMEIMETRMEIEAALASGDEAERARWVAWAGAQRAGYAGSAGAALASAADETARREARRTLNAWRYIERLIEQLDPDYDPASADFS